MSSKMLSVLEAMSPALFESTAKSLLADSDTESTAALARIHEFMKELRPDTAAEERAVLEKENVRADC
jgi:hypothetical protein